MDCHLQLAFTLEMGKNSLNPDHPALEIVGP